MRYLYVAVSGRWPARVRLVPALFVLLTLVLVTGGGAIALNSVRSAAAQEALIVRPDAPEWVLDGAQFDVDVIVEGVTDLAGAVLTLTYDPTLLTFVQAVPNAVLDGCQSDDNLPAPGTLELAVFCSTDRDGTPLTLWTVTFDNVAVATTIETTIAVSQAELASEFLVLLPSTPQGAALTLNPRADLSITMTASAEPVGPGGAFSYEITVTNNGPAEATSVTITNSLPSETSFLKLMSVSNCTHFTGTVTCDLGSLPSGGGTTTIFRVTLDESADSQIENTATVKGAKVDPDPINDTATTASTLNDAVTIRVLAPEVVAPADTVQVQIQADSAEDLGGAEFAVLFDATRFSLTGTQPGSAFAGCLSTSFVPSADRVNTIMVCTSGRSGAPLGFWTLTFEVDTEASSGDASFSLEDIRLGDVQLDPQAVPAIAVDAQVRVSRTTDLSIAKTDSRDPVVAGTSMTYTVTVTNDGPEDAFGIVVIDQLPPEVAFGSATQGCVYDGPSHALTCTVGDLANGASADVAIDVNVQPGTAGLISNTASVTSFEIDPNGANDAATEHTFILAPPTLTGTASASVAEGGDGVSTTVDIGVSLSSSIDLPVDVHYSTSEGTANSADSDFTAVADGVLTIPAGSTEGTLQVEVIGDARWEHDEIFTVTITSAEIRGTFVSLDILGGTTTVTVQNDDDPPTIAIQETLSVTEGNPGVTVTAELEITLSGLSGLSISVQVDTVDGTATVANADYVPLVGESLTIPPDTLSGKVQVDIVGDDRYELDESFAVVLSNPLAQENGAQPTIASPTSTVTIVNDDPLPTVSTIGSASVIEGGEGTTTTVDIVVTLSNVLDVIVTVDYSTSEGTATAEQDFQSASGTATVPLGQTTTLVSLQIDGDDTIEGDETFHLLLSSATSSLGAIPIAFPVSSTVTILDDDSVVVAQSSLMPAVDGDGVAVVEIRVERFKFQGGELTFELPGGIQSFDATLAFDTELVEILGVRGVTEFGSDPTFNSTSTPGQLTVSDSTASPVTTTPLVLARIVVRLIGSNASSTQLTLTSLRLTEAGTGTVYDQEAQASNTYQRGDVRADGQIRATDRLFLTQCVLQLRAVGSGVADCNAINAASVLHDGANGDIVDEFDGLYISEFVVELRDALFDLVN